MKSVSEVAPQPVTVTPELLAQHSITAEEYEAKKRDLLERM